MLSWFGRLAGWVTITTVAWAELSVRAIWQEKETEFRANLASAMSSWLAATPESYNG